MPTPQSQAFWQALMDLADTLDARIAEGQGQGTLTQPEAEALQVQGNALRSHANALLADEVLSLLAGLADDQAQILAALTAAKVQLQRIQHMEKLVPLVAAVVFLGACLVGSIAKVPSALQTVQASV